MPWGQLTKETTTTTTKQQRRLKAELRETEGNKGKNVILNQRMRKVGECLRK